MPQIKQSTVVITDTSCFIILEKIKALDILKQVFDVIITTPEIALEYGQPLPLWVKVRTVNNIILQQKFKQKIDSGEASAIALAKEITCEYLLTDDLAARKFAESLGLRVKGSVVILLYAKQKGAITAIKPYLEQIQETNFRIQQRLSRMF